jgi:anhydro-N-acetylmuramic acid kinase
MDALVSHFTRKKQKYDRWARLARQGQVNERLLKELLRDPYLKLGPPKSTGREYYGRAYFQELLRLGRKHRAGPNDLIRTTTEFTVASVVDALKRFVLRKTKVQQLIVSGGGARNPLILAQLTALLTPIKVLTSSKLGVPEEAKEAYAFAILAYETWHRRAGNLPSATGAEREAVLGKISLGKMTW